MTDDTVSTLAEPRTIESQVLGALDHMRNLSGGSMRFYPDKTTASVLGMHLTQVKDALIRLQRKGVIVRWNGMAGRKEWM